VVSFLLPDGLLFGIHGEFVDSEIRADAWHLFHFKGKDVFEFFQQKVQVCTQSSISSRPNLHRPLWTAVVQNEINVFSSRLGTELV
jgi:hypothetical protein